MAPHELHDHDRGLNFDLSTLIERRRALKLFGGASLAVLVGCGSDAKSSTSSSSASSASSASASATTTPASATTIAAADCTTIPNETAGPYPGDGSNGPNVLTQSGIVRSDITASFGSSSTVAKGVPLAITLNVVDTAKACAPLAGAAVYLWHCNIAGLYSMYSQGVTNENYLRGVQQTDSNGSVTFKSIFPAAYSGRWPHIHFEVYPSLAAATSAGTKTATSQLALPQDVCNTVYATSGYEQSVKNMAQTSLARDNVFSDGADSQTPSVTGTVGSGFVATLAVPV
jgi:protocatechuate 3,4-dioxygenase beta subunit